MSGIWLQPNFCWLHSSKWTQTDFTEVASKLQQDSERPFLLLLPSWKTPPGNFAAPHPNPFVSGHCVLDATGCRGTQGIRQKGIPEVVHDCTHTHAHTRLVQGPDHKAGSSTALTWTLMIQMCQGGEHLAVMNHPALLGAQGLASFDGGCCCLANKVATGDLDTKSVLTQQSACLHGYWSTVCP